MVETLLLGRSKLTFFLTNLWKKSCLFFLYETASHNLRDFFFLSFFSRTFYARATLFIYKYVSFSFTTNSGASDQPTKLTSRFGTSVQDFQGIGTLDTFRMQRLTPRKRDCPWLRNFLNAKQLFFLTENTVRSVVTRIINCSIDFHWRICTKHLVTNELLRLMIYITNVT